MHWPAWTIAAAPSFSGAGWRKANRRRCMSWPPNTACRRSASARSKPRRCIRCAACWVRPPDTSTAHRKTGSRALPVSFCAAVAARSVAPEQQLEVGGHGFGLFAVAHVEPQPSLRIEDVAARRVVYGVAAGRGTGLLLVEHAEGLGGPGGRLGVAVQPQKIRTERR